MQLAYNGRLRLLLDGWNELDPESRLAAKAQKARKSLQRQSVNRWGLIQCWPPRCFFDRLPRSGP